jgi:uncharacterized lipoprotein
MQLLKKSLISVVVLGLTACSSLSGKYGFFKDEAQSYKKAPPLEHTVVIPQNLSAKNVQDYYEVSQPAPEAANIEPPLTPPGSSLSQAPQPHVIAPTSQQDKIRNAENAKIQGHTLPAARGPKPVGINYSQAWVKVGHVLQAANYKVVEKDNLMGVYYVVDTSTTSGKVKKDMPIYQVNLKPSGNGTLVTVIPSNSRLQETLSRSLND